MFDDADRQAFLGLLATVSARHGLVVHAYCLMANHYHLVAETPSGGLSRGMRRLNGVWAQLSNRRHGRVGHVFQGRYKAFLLERDEHLLQAVRYVVLNPVRARIVTHPAGYPWSSYRATLGIDPVPSFLTNDRVLGQFRGSAARARERFRDFVEGSLEAESPLEQALGVVVGTDQFAVRHTAGLERDTEIALDERRPVRPELPDLLAAAGESAILAAYHDHGYTLAEIAAQLGCHYSTVSRRLRLLEQGAQPPPRRKRTRRAP